MKLFGGLCLCMLVTFSPLRARATMSDDIARLELAASRGERSASDDLNRGLSYLRRALSQDRASQDMGQAIAALQAARAHTGDAQVLDKAQRALSMAHAEQQNVLKKAGIEADFSPSEGAWRDALRIAGTERVMGMAFVFALALCAALLVRRSSKGLLVSLGIAYLLSATAALYARQTADEEAVVIVDDARPVDTAHVPIAGGALTPGAKLRVQRIEPGWVRLRLHGETVLLPESAVRIL